MLKAKVKKTKTKKIAPKKKSALKVRPEEPVKKIEKEKKVPKVKKTAKYYEGVGKRKTATARVRIFSQGEKNFLVNEKLLDKYFPIPQLQQISLSSLEIMDLLGKFGVSVKVKGGGLNAQAEAIRNGMAKALVVFNPDFRKKLKKAGFLTRDPRMRERKKFGLKRARRAPQWSKR
jgi:small subunit ribosomal protein S9